MKHEKDIARREAAYYKNIAKKTGDLFLKEMQELSKLISILKQTKAELRENEEKLRNIFEHSNELFYIHNTEHQFIYISPQCKDFFGYTTDEMKIKWTELLTDNPINQTGFEITEKAIRTGKKQGLYILEGKKKDGQVILLEINETPVKNESGQVVAIVGVARDVTMREKLESDLRQTYKMEAIGTLTGGIAHDFNNILGIIIGNIELALHDVPEWNPAYVNLEAIKSASLRARDFVRQLLSFSRKTEKDKKPIKIDKLIDDTTMLLRSSIQTSIEIRTDISENIKPINADSTQIQQVIINLCTNAAQAMEENGGVLTISLKEVALSGEFFPGYHEISDGQYIQLTVCDTGHGIKKNIIEKIFDPYFTTRDTGKGTGMGLAVVQGIVKNHDGAISVFSLPRKGTTINVFFPVCEEEPIEKKMDAMKLPPGSEKILFVDDEKYIVSMTRQMLERLGYQVKALMNPIEALELFQSKPDGFDLVITDMTMPQMTGVELFKKIKKIRKKIPIIICTGYSSQINESKAKELGIAAFVMKPIEMQLISQTIRQVLDNKKGS